MKRKRLEFLLLIILFFLIGACSKNEDSPNQVQEAKPWDKFDVTLVPEAKLIINDILQLSDSSYVLAGSANYDENMLLKLDKYGNEVWYHSIEKSYSPWGLEAVFSYEKMLIGVQTSRYSSGTLPGFSIFNQDGEVLNHIAIENCIVGTDIIKDAGSIVIAGGVNQMQVQRVSFEGEQLWRKNHDQHIKASSISKLSDGNYIIIGNRSNTLYSDYLMKYSSDGKVIWSKQYKGEKVLGLPDNGCIAITYSYESKKYSIIRFDESGNELWNNEIHDANRHLYYTGAMNIFNFSSDYFAYSILTEDKQVILNVLNSSGDLVNSVKIDYVNVFHRNAIIKTLDNGLLYVRSKDDLGKTVKIKKLNYLTIIGSTN